MWNLFKNKEQEPIRYYGLTSNDYVDAFEQVGYKYDHLLEYGKPNIVLEIYKSDNIELHRVFGFAYAFTKMIHKLKINDQTITMDGKFIEPIYQELTKRRKAKEEIEKMNLSMDLLSKLV